MDFADIKAAFKPILDLLDHSYLNEIPGLENPTSENIVRWIWVRLQSQLAGLIRIDIAETCVDGCSYRGDDD